MLALKLAYWGNSELWTNSADTESQPIQVLPALDLDRNWNAITHTPHSILILMYSFYFFVHIWLQNIFNNFNSFVLSFSNRVSIKRYIYCEYKLLLLSLSPFLLLLLCWASRPNISFSRPVVRTVSTWRCHHIWVKIFVLVFNLFAQNYFILWFRKLTASAICHVYNRNSCAHQTDR